MDMKLKEGATLQKGKYTIVKSLGQGSFGITYLATTKIAIIGKLGQMDTTVNVAIKEFFISEINSRANDGSSINGSGGTLFVNYRKNFRKEAENLSHLDHPNIVKVLEVFDENNTTYYVMQYIDGESLDDYILRKKGIQEFSAIAILKDIGSAIHYMHSHKMLHLDLKPKNVMMDKDGKSYLIDFGLSKQYTENGEPESSTTIGPGTMGYAPIEQANYKQDGSFPKTLDVYALGATFYKMLSGNKPQYASEILEEGLDIVPLSKKGVSQSVVNAVQKAMAPTKKYRYQTIDEFLSALNISVSSYKGKSKKHGFTSKSINEETDTSYFSSEDTDFTFVDDNYNRHNQDEMDLRQLVEQLVDGEEYKEAYKTCLQYIKENRCKAIAQELSREIVPLMKEQNQKQNRKQIVIVTIITIIVMILSILLNSLR